MQHLTLQDPHDPETKLHITAMLGMVIVEVEGYDGIGHAVELTKEQWLSMAKVVEGAIQ